MTSVRRIAPAVAALALLALPTAAMASSRDSDRDGMPNRWEKSHGLKVHKADARGDKDHDGLKNLAEYRLGTDPRNADSDDDGVKDGHDVGGKVDSFTGGVLTIALPDGTKVSGKVVDGDTELKCRTATPTTAPIARKADHGQDDSHGNGDRSGRGDGDDDHGDDEDSSEHGDDTACGVEALTAGTTVHEAELEITSAGAVWDEVELLK
jgi:hypothetical protein